MYHLRFIQSLFFVVHGLFNYSFINSVIAEFLNMFVIIIEVFMPEVLSDLYNNHTL
jgi:hypothetical protein